MYVVWSYIVYLIISLMLTVWVAQTLYKNGRIFLVDAFHGNEPVAESVNHLLVVGFYLINIGYVTLALKYGDKPTTTQESIEFLSTKIGLVLVILGVMHFFNIFNFAKMRQKGTRLGHGTSALPVLPANDAVEALRNVHQEQHGFTEHAT